MHQSFVTAAGLKAWHLSPALSLLSVGMGLHLMTGALTEMFHIGAKVLANITEMIESLNTP